MNRFVCAHIERRHLFGLPSSMLGKSDPNILSQMVGLDVDESHGTIRTKNKQIQGDCITKL